VPRARGRYGGRRIAISVVVLTAILAASAVAAHRGIRSVPGNAVSAWSESPWNMPLDNWGEGRAWHATAPDGADLRLFARTKSGFCNCYSGVANDDEIDRIGDVDLHGDDFTPVAAGTETSIGALAGRKQLFRTRGRWTSGRYVLSIVAATDCKAIVATIVSNETISSDAEATAVALLTGEEFRQWAANRQ